MRIKVILISSEKTNIGLTLTDATHIILVDTLHEDKDYCDLMENKLLEEQSGWDKIKT